MRSAIKQYLGMISIAVVIVVVMGAVGVRIDQDQTPDDQQGIAATPLAIGNAPEMLVDASWLKKYQSQVDYVFDLSDLRVFEQGHIPGAHHIWWQDAMNINAANYAEAEDISVNVNGRNLWSRLQLNVPQNARIVLYDDNDSERAAWMLWVMRSAGYGNVVVLDGGLSAWIGVDGDVSTEPAAALDESVEATPGWNDQYTIYQTGMVKALDDPDAVIIDTRTAEQQKDTVNETTRPGHIPGAINITNQDVMREDGTFKSKDELQHIFEVAGIEPDDPIAVYGLFSKDAGTVWLALQIAGYSNAQLLFEGYVSWGYNEDLPIETDNFTIQESTQSATPNASPQATPLASPVASPVSTPVATPEGNGERQTQTPDATQDDGGTPTDLTGN